MQTAHLQRVSDAHKHGDPTVRKALSSNSLQRFDNSNGGNNKSGNGNPNNGNGQGNGQGKKNGKKNGKNSDNNNNSSTSNSETATTTSTGNTGNTSTSSTSNQLDKKLKRRLAMAISCSVCGYEAGHNDMDCFKNPDTDENKQAIVENRKDSRMKDFFRNIDNAKRKRI